MLKVLIASKNQGKIREIKQILVLPGLRLLSYEDVDDWGEIRETGKTYEENAYLKAQFLLRKFGLPVVADDSGLEVEALGGRPGVNSALYAGEKAADEERVKKLLTELEGVPEEHRRARFRCIALFLSPLGEVITAEGVLEGRIGFEPRGSGGFGYDPVFIPDGCTKTLAELSLQEKNKLSHRGKAFRRLREKLEAALI